MADETPRPQEPLAELSRPPEPKAEVILPPGVEKPD
jgi:hypothetical protein